MVSASGIPRLLSEKRAPHLDSEDYKAAAHIFPMRANNYVVEQLIDWTNVPNDPIFRLVFPQPGMLAASELQRLKLALRSNVDNVTIRAIAEQIRAKLNPHPANQKTENGPRDPARPHKTEASLPGIQHKYRETVLFFPTEAQYCHSFCTYCFRWAQFTAVGSEQTFQSKDAHRLADYLAHSPDVSDLLFTGGDPMVMKTRHWQRYLTPIFEDERLSHLATIRIGTKSLAYWPERFVNDADAASTLQLFRRICDSGRQLSIMAHFSHPVELSTPLVKEAVRRIRSTGAQIRCQAPLVRGINDDPATWANMWRKQVRMGMVPYYMFVERDTGAKHFFEVPLQRAFEIYKTARKYFCILLICLRLNADLTQALTPAQLELSKDHRCQLPRAKSRWWASLKFPHQRQVLEPRNPNTRRSLFCASSKPGVRLGAERPCLQGSTQTPAGSTSSCPRSVRKSGSSSASTNGSDDKVASSAQAASSTRWTTRCELVSRCESLRSLLSRPCRRR